MPRPTVPLELTAEERVDLEAIATSRSMPHGLVRRAQLILWSESGVPLNEVGRRLKVSGPTVHHWRLQFRKLRLAGLHDQLKPGRPRTHDEEQIAQLLKTALSQKPKAATHWSVRTLADSTGVSKSTVQRYLTLFGVQPHRSKAFKLSTDPFFIEKVRDIVGLYLNPPDHALVLCVDEKSQIQALDRTAPLLPMRPGQIERRTHDYKRHGTTSLFAALDMASGKVIGSLRQHHRATEFKRFLIQIDKEVPTELDVHLILDNYATHKTPEIKRRLLRHPRFHLHFTPTSGSWLNMVERWFGELTTKKIKRGAHTSVKALEKDIREWIKNWNDNPRPYVWVKTADEILAALARYCERVSAAASHGLEA